MAKGWDSAKRYKPKPIGETGAHKPIDFAALAAQAHTPDVEPEVLSEEDRATINRYYMALRELADESVHFAKNYKTFQKWDDATRFWWIGQIERQAADGKNTIGAHVVTRVIMNRIGD